MLCETMDCGTLYLTFGFRGSVMTSRQEFAFLTSLQLMLLLLVQGLYFETHWRSSCSLHTSYLTSGTERGEGVCIILDSQTCSWEPGWMRPLLKSNPCWSEISSFIPTCALLLITDTKHPSHRAGLGGKEEEGT